MGPIDKRYRTYLQEGVFQISLLIAGIMQPRTGIKVMFRKTGGFEGMDIMPSLAKKYLKAQALILVSEWYLAWMTNHGLVITKPNRMLFFHSLAMLLWRGKR
jgi:hypothetical protein